MEAVVHNQVGSNQRWWHRKDLLSLNLLLTCALVTSAYNGYDGSMMNGLQAVTPWQDYFNHPHGSKLGLFNAIQNIGSIAAIPFSPFLADHFGRRTTIFLGSLIMLAGVAIQTAAQNFGMFIAARGIIGFGVQWAQMASPLLVAELAYPTHRATATSLYNCLWYLGSIIAAWSTLGTFYITNNWSWRIPSLLQGLPGIFQVCLIWFVPESPRWLVSKGREADAARVLAKYHAQGDMNDPIVAFEVTEIKEALRIEEEAKRDTNWLVFLNTKGNRKRLMLIVAISFFSQWSGNGLVSYYLHSILNEVGITSNPMQLLINGILQIWNLFMAVSAAVVCERLGRRTLFLSSNIGMLLSWVIWTALVATYVIHHDIAAGKAVVAFIFIYYSFYDLAYTPLLVAYTVEILPFKLRAKGVALMNFCVSASLVFNQYINPIAQDHIGWKYYLVYVAWLAFELIFVYFFLIETKGKTLEETALLFDGNAEEVKNIATDKVEGQLGDNVGSDAASDAKTPTSEKDYSHHELRA